MVSKKDRRKRPDTIHPKKKYSDNPPDFVLLASLYPSFKDFVFYSRDGRPRIDWTNFNSTRELTRVLLLHDHGLNCVFCELNTLGGFPMDTYALRCRIDQTRFIGSRIFFHLRYHSKIIQQWRYCESFDIGTGANGIYPLLALSLLGMDLIVGVRCDCCGTRVGREKNVKSNFA
ncbi:hypothetical protein D5086_018603 [Populus alba]|uniref:Uncharacterized protein n=1 Tax=Populus alba TaxID=43335 RepID=A0ACC4BQ59_POPAL